MPNRERLSQLAIGVAHDLNNILTVILSYARLIREDLGGTHASCPDLNEIEKAGQRGMALTRWLASFRRTQGLDLNGA